MASAAASAYSIEAFLRLSAYWVTIFFAFWYIVFNILWSRAETAVWYHEFQATYLVPMGIDKAAADTVAHHTSPWVIAASFSFLVLTRTPLPAYKTSWISKHVFGRIPWFHETRTTADGTIIKPRNQFFVGDINLNYLSVLISLVPAVVYALSFFFRFLKFKTTPIDKLGHMSVVLAYGALVALSIFLIPVARHSVLLAAMGWSPIKAIRIHQLSGYWAFGLAMLHGLFQVIVWFYRVPELGPVSQQVSPYKECWDWNRSNYYSEKSNPCVKQMFKLTGMITGSVFLLLVLSSINYIRRKWYRIFYICHMTLGPAFLVLIMWHWAPSILFIIPSLAYYFASTIPTIVQAIASRFRGGHMIVQVKDITAGDGAIIEVAVAVNKEIAASLQREQNQYVKMLVPKISLIWHPFTCYKDPKDDGTVRMLIRAAGPYTKSLSQELLSSNANKPVTILDGFYRGKDMVGQAIHFHDHVSIVTGGVAITPYLSFLPILLDRLAKEATLDHCQTKTIAFHWACREQELYHYIKANHLEEIERKGRALANHGIKLEICLYYTGKGSLGKCKRVAAAKSSGYSTDSLLSSSDEEESAVRPKTISDTSSFDDIETDKNETTYATAGSKSAGFAMELARLLPGRHGRFLPYNLPAFVAFGGLLWLGFYILFDWYLNRVRDTGDDNLPLHNIFIVRIWSIFIVFVSVVVISFLIEGICLAFNDYFPVKLDDYETISTSPSSPYLQEEEDDDIIVTSDWNVVVKERRGRPSAERILEKSRDGETPGIFLCGPVALMQAVKDEARKENKSYLLKTRYCIYEESFEL